MKPTRLRNKTEHTMKALRKFLAALVLGALGIHLVAPSTHGATLTHTIQGLLNTNYTGFVIDADANVAGPAYHREHLRVQSRVRTVNSDPIANVATYYLRFRLLNSSGQAHPLYDSPGNLSPDGTYSLTNTFGIAAGISISRTNVAALRPAAPLNAAETYAVELRLFTPGGLRETDSSTLSPQSFMHFTNLVSNDPGFNVIATVDQVAFARPSAVQTDPDRNSFEAEVEYTLGRYDNFLASSGPTDLVPITLSYQLIDNTTGLAVPLATSSTNFQRALFKYHPPPPDDPVAPWVQSATRTVRVRPANGVQLDSVDHRYRLSVTISHQEQAGLPGTTIVGNTVASPAAQLLHFNGTLRFGSLHTTFSSIDNDPLVIATAPGSHVTTVLSVDDQSGTIPSLPGALYGDGTDLSVRLLANGEAVSQGVDVPIVLPPAAGAEIAHVRIDVLPPAVLNPQGLLSSIRVHLPTGLGYRFDTVGHILRRSFIVANVPLGPNFQPLNDVTFSPPDSIYVAEETKPLWLETTAILWRVAQGRFDLTVNNNGAQHVRSDEYARLEAVHNALENPQRSLKRANDRYYQAVATVASPAVVDADARRVARLDLSLTLAPGSFQSHFPYGALIQWDGAAALEIENDQFNSDTSQLTGVGLVGLGYGTGCTGIDCGEDGPTRILRLAPSDGILRFTRDGGLIAGGQLDAPHRLRWGYIQSLASYAHEAFHFSAATFHMPGHALRGDQSGSPLPLKAPTLLYTGVAATNLTYLERPDAPGTLNDVRYAAGFADYAGMNLVVGGDGDRDGHSTLAGTPSGTYQLKGISKYYARRGGVTGIHDAVPGSFAETLTLYGYQFNFDNFGLSCLDNRMQDSLINGLVAVPAPSDFTLDFAGLRLNCLGAVENAPMPAPQTERLLAYWNGRFDAHALQFRRHPDDLCNVSAAFLTVGAETEVAHVAGKLSGTLGFRPDGNLLPRAAGVTDVDSRLKLPNVIHVAGPRNETYLLNPVADVYFNGHDQLQGYSPASQTAPDFGWVNIAATIDVPFFEDLRVHVQTSATAGNTNAPIFMLGGWPGNGWQIANQNYFTAEYFDPTNAGYATAVSPNTYRSSESDQYHPRAQRTWLDIIQFDYPLTWSSITRDFRSRAPQVDDLMVLSTEHELKYLSADNAELTFGAQFDGLPQFNFANLAVQAIDFATAGAQDELASRLIDMVGGFGRLDEILSADLQPFFSGIFDQTIQPQIEQLRGQLESAYLDGVPDWFEAAGDQVLISFVTDGNSISNKLNDLIGATTGVPGMLQRLESYLTQAEQAVFQVRSIIEENDAGNRTIATELMRLLVHNLALQFAGGFLDEFIQPILAEADPTLDQIELVLGNLQGALGQIRTNLIDPVAGIRAELQNVFATHQVSLNATVSQMMAGVGDFIADIDLALDSPVDDYTPEEIQQRIRREIEDRFYGTPLAAAIQVVHRHRLYDLDAAIRQATDTLFQQINQVMRQVISETAEELNSQFTKFLGPLENIAAAASINGYAHINGDSLKEARVDLHARIEVGSALEFNGYLQVKELDSQGSPGCTYDGAATVTEVSLGAEDVQIGWISPDLRASIGTKFTFDDGPGFPLRGLGGSFELTGLLEYEAFAINFLGATIALGQDENFLSAAAGMRVNQYEVFGGIYFGRSCTIDPIRMWDPDAADLLGDGTFTGIYAYGEGWVPINELIGIPASCLFNISAGLGMGAGVFLEGPTFLAKMKAGVSGEALCTIGIKGEVTGTAVLEGLDLNVLDGLSVKARGTVGGKFGPCPFCLEVEQSVALTFKQGRWKLDF
jgi:hypothetical protein